MAAAVVASRLTFDFFPRAGNGGTGAARTPVAPSAAKAVHGRPVGQAGRERLPRASRPAPAPPVSPRWCWGPMAQTAVLSKEEGWEWTGAGWCRGPHSGLPRG